MLPSIVVVTDKIHFAIICFSPTVVLDDEDVSWDKRPREWESLIEDGRDAMLVPLHKRVVVFSLDCCRRGSTTARATVTPRVHQCTIDVNHEELKYTRALLCCRYIRRELSSLPRVPHLDP